ncbi:hypothetical protein Pcinc_011368 [Petrolisthes cinctipes]|uniref:Uncharacterized protein n=1 Tax=Petrolisthes cinctipes TaxID=88211 RepID=A0AAE1G3R3_PETCI|nr:hypothetical protein Pcinc_011368 [Petrolisthes cinctipes]
MKVSESATQADTLRQAVASILTHPSPKPLAEEQISIPRGDGNSPRKRPRSHIPTTEEDSATLTPAKKQHQDATLNDISSLLLQFAQRFDKLESGMSIVKGSNSQLQQDREKGKTNLPFSSSSSPSCSLCQFNAFFLTVTQPTTLFSSYLLANAHT